MSEKRFTTKNIVCSNYCVWDNNDKPYGNDEVVDLLNYQDRLIEEQHDEIINWTKKYVGIKKENEQLRRLFEEMKQPITVNLTEEDEKELRKLLGIDLE